jgi:L-rhamnose mutarotase
VKTYCLALDLKDDPALIAEYRRWHQPEHIWPEVVRHIRQQGVLREQIFLLGTRMVMVIETCEDFSFEARNANDQASPVMRRWESLMNGFQQPLPQAANGEKWVLMEKIFDI